MTLIPAMGSRRKSEHFSTLLLMQCHLSDRLGADCATEGSPLPTLRNCMLRLGETRGQLFMLYMAFGEKRVAYEDPRSDTTVAISDEEIATSMPGGVYWTREEINNQYSDRAIICVSCEKLSRDSEEYHLAVVGCKPRPELPDPARVLNDFIKYELDRSETALQNYLSLEETKKG